MQTMKVAEYDRYGRAEVIEVRERPVPVPRAGEVRIRVHAAALNPKDVLTRGGKFPLFAGPRFPKRMGYDLAGEVVELGPNVRDVQLGEHVFGMIEAWRAGACAEYAVARASTIAPKPPSLSWEEAASLPLAALTALQALRDHGGVRAGQRVLVNGASGGVGVHAVQIAKALGAYVITTSSARNIDFLRTLGVDETLDYATDDVESVSPTVDTYLDAFGNRSFARVRRSLSPTGTYVTTIPSPKAVADHLRTAFRAQRGRLVVVRSRRQDLEALAGFVATGSLRPVIAKTFTLDEVADAHRVLETRRTRGKLVIRVS